MICGAGDLVWTESPTRGTRIEQELKVGVAAEMKITKCGSLRPAFKLDRLIAHRPVNVRVR